METDALERRTPLGPFADTLRRVCTGARFTCVEDAFRVLTEIRCSSTSVHLAADIAGGALPSVGGYVEQGRTRILALGPCWWMLDAPDGSIRILGSSHVSAVEVSAQRTTFILDGTHVREVLAHGCAIDLHP